MIQIGGVCATFCQQEGILLQKIAIEMGGVSRHFSKNIGVRGRCDFPEPVVCLPMPWHMQHIDSGPEEGVITKGVFSVEESLKSLDSLENGRTLLYSPQSGGSRISLESLNSLESLETELF